MAWIEEHQLIALVAVLAVIALIVIFRYRGGFSAKAAAFGGSVELEGKGADPKDDVIRTPVDQGVSAPGEGSVAIGRDANRSTIITGDRNRTR